MMKYINTLIFILCTITAFAQVPQKFNYQAVARNAQGNPLPNQAIKIRASILDGSTNGTSQYSETHNATTSQLGLFNLAIGGGTVVSGNFSNVTWANGDKYLKIEMDATGGNNYSLVGTSQLLSVPYALNAGNGSQWENNSNGIDYPGQNVGIGVDDPSGKLHLVVNSTEEQGLRVSDGENSNITIQPVESGFQAGPSGFQAINFNGYFNNNSGNTGIGGESIYNQDKSRWRLAADQRFGFDHFLIDVFRPNATDIVGTPFVIAPNGYVGLGIQGFTPFAPEYPKARLHVQNGDVYLENGKLGVKRLPDFFGYPNYPADSNIVVQINGDLLTSGGKGNSAGRIIFENSNHQIFRDTMNNIVINTTTFFGAPSGQGNLILLDGGTAANGVHSNTGNVGINTMNPKAKLHVSNGDIYIENISSGVIMKSPNGNCWRMTVNNQGQPVFTSIACP